MPSQIRKAQPYLLFCLLLGLTTVLHLLFAPAAHSSPIGPLELLSVGSDGQQGDGSTFFVYMSADNRYAAFESWATNWADPSLANSWIDIFVRDRLTGQTRQITYDYSGGPTDEDSFDPVLSADGRYVAYFSYATNLVPGDTNDHEWLRRGLDLFLYDQLTGQTVRLSVNENGEQIAGNTVGNITPDGKIALLNSNGRNVILSDDNADQRAALYWKEWQTGHIERITHGVDGLFPNGIFVNVWGSSEGQYIVYSSDASNLVPNDTNGVLDIFLYERASGQTRRISVGPGGEEANDLSGQPQISADGRYVVFRSFASNLVAGDTNGFSDIFLYDIVAGSLSRVSVGPGGQQTNNESKDPSLCAAGRFVSFSSDATNLVPGDSNNERDIFLVEVATGVVTAVSRNSEGVWGNGRAHRSYLAPNCDAISFASDADNLLPDDNNGWRDIFWQELSDTPLLAVQVMAPGAVQADALLPITLNLHNNGPTPLSHVEVHYTIPSQTSYVAGSSTAGVEASEGQINWQGTVPAGSTVSLSFSLRVSATPTTAYTLAHHLDITGDAAVSKEWQTIVNGSSYFLPLLAHN